jgi:hypothetical protein
MDESGIASDEYFSTHLIIDNRGKYAILESRRGIFYAYCRPNATEYEKDQLSSRCGKAPINVYPFGRANGFLRIGVQ